MDFDHRDRDSRDDERFGAERHHARDGTPDFDGDDWRQPEDRSRDRDDDVRTLGRGPGDSRDPHADGDPRDRHNVRWLEREAPDRAFDPRLVLPQSLRRAFTAYRTVVREELEGPPQADMIYDLKRYFFHRRRGTDLHTIPESLRAFLDGCTQAFAGPRYTHLYRRWLTEENAALTPVSPAIPEALASARAQVECVVLPHAYEHLSPLVSRRRLQRRRLRKGDERGDDTGAQHQPVP